MQGKLSVKVGGIQIVTSLTVMGEARHISINN